MKNLIKILAVLILFGTVASCKKKSEDQSAELQLYHNGEIMTMEGEEPVYAEAVVSDNDKIVFVGTLKDAKAKYPKAKKVDLKGKTMLPAFLDGHGHMFNVGMVSLVANILPPPDGPGKDYQSIIDALNTWKESADGKEFIETNGWIIGNGYDDSQLVERDHPKADDLDKVSTDKPVMIMHQSGHLGSLNHKALEMMGWIGQCENPKEGVLRRNTDGTPNGVLEENAFFLSIEKAFKNISEKEIEKIIELGQESYAKNGYLTAQEGRTAPDQVKFLEKAAADDKLYIDVVSYPDMRLPGAYDLLNASYYSPEHKYTNNFRIGGVKLTLDGSPQGKTAWLTSHYHRPPVGKDTDYSGFPIMSDEQANQYVEDAYKNKWQILCHTNGDAAIDQYLTAIEKAKEKYDYDDPRTVIIHGQTIRRDQLEKAAKMDVDASLFPMHTFYWGDWHVESVLGHPRADYISPCKDAIELGLNITSHHDAPVTFPNSMRVLDATVNRVTRSGYVLGPDQRLSVFDGLRTLTVWAAYQYFEEDQKGTIAPGKFADFVILDKNPTKIDPLKIHEIKILESIRRGKSVYKNK